MGSAGRCWEGGAAGEAASGQDCRPLIMQVRAVMEYGAPGALASCAPPALLSASSSQGSRSSVPVAPTLAPSQSSGAWREGPAARLGSGVATTFPQDPAKQGPELLHLIVRTEQR